MPVSLPNSMYRRSLFWLSMLMTSMILASQCWSQQAIRFPYQALVRTDQAMVRSGPGEVHYGTEKLSVGQTVEVYRHDPGGWCAIRPTNQSFCILPETTIEIIDEGIGQVIEEGTTPFVGTALGAVDNPLWQVKLHAGEKLSVIGQLSWPNPAGHSTIWYQIKPPSGEFRWIHLSDIESLDSPSPHQKVTLEPASQSVTQPKTIAASPSRQTTVAERLPAKRDLDAVTQTGVEPVDSQFDLKAAQPPTVIQADDNSTTTTSPVVPASYTSNPRQSIPDVTDSGSGWRRASRPIPTADEQTVSERSSTATRWTGASTPAGRPNATTGNIEHSNTFYPRADPSQRFASTAVDRGGFAESILDARSESAISTVNSPSIRRLNSRLTQEMLKSPSEWNLDYLVSSAENLRSSGNPGERIEAQQFLAKLDDCQKITNGFRGRTSSVANAHPASISTPFPKPVFGANQTGNVADDSANRPIGGDSAADFDATGWLNELKQAGGTQPSTYVLQDRSGKIIAQVSPIPGLNISRYLKTAIGVRGQRGYNHRLKLPHITAERIFSL